MPNNNLDLATRPITKVIRGERLVRRIKGGYTCVVNMPSAAVVGAPQMHPGNIL